MAGMINCMKFKLKEGQAEALFKAFAEYTRDYPFDEIMQLRASPVMETLIASQVGIGLVR